MMPLSNSRVIVARWLESPDEKGGIFRDANGNPTGPAQPAQVFYVEVFNVEVGNVEAGNVEVMQHE